MTLSMCWNNYDGAVLGCDSTTTITVQLKGTPNPSTQKHYNSAQKLFELGPSEREFNPGDSFSGGAIVAGAGAFGKMSWRSFLSRLYVHHLSPILRGNPIQVSAFAEIILSMANKLWNKDIKTSDQLPDAKLFFAYVHKEEVRAVQVDLQSGQHTKVGAGSVSASGMTEPLQRLGEGIGGKATTILEKHGVPTEVISEIKHNSWGQQAFNPFVPLRDMVDLVHYAIYLTSKFYRYAIDVESKHGEPVGGAVEIATVTEDRGFRWVIHKSFTESLGIPHGGAL